MSKKEETVKVFYNEIYRCDIFPSTENEICPLGMRGFHCTFPFLLGVGLSLLPNFQKEGGMTESQFLERGC